MSRVSVITLSSLLLVGLVAAVTIGVLNYVHVEDKKPNTSAKAVQEMCQPTDYKEACFKSLAKVNSDDPKELVKAAFDSTINEISEVSNKSLVLQELEKDPKTVQAVKDCKELFQDAIDDLQRSFEHIGEFEVNKVNMVLENLKIWLSATITYQETCLDGFDNTTGDANEKVRKILQTAMQMSSNGLAIVSDMSSLLGTLDISTFNRRRLLADDRQVVGHDDNNVIPYWLRNRRLLSSADDQTEGHGDNTLLEDDEPDRRRRRLLSSVSQVVGHDDDEMLPIWFDATRRKLLQATNLAEDLKAKANVVVAQDGSGKYKTIEEALKDIPKNGNESFIIYIKEGVYNEYLVLFKWMKHVVFIGDGPTKTRITNNKNFVDGVKTFKTATLSVLGDFFMAKDIGIENSAGAIKHQAVALRVQSDQSIFFNCHMDGYQDTLYTHTYRQFYRDCRVTGTIDFIFGDAAAFFQNCTFVVRKPLENQRCIVTAQGRMERHQPTGIIIHKSRFEADPDYYPIRKKNTAYLGRPWKEYSKTIIMESYIDDLIAPEGWLPWEGTFGLETCYYGEYNNEGPGSDMSSRVKWRGIKTILPSRAEKFMPPQLYQTDDWITASGVPYDPTLSAFAPGPGGYDEDPNAPAGAPSALPTYYSGSSYSSHVSSGSSSSKSSSSSSSSSSSGAHSSSSSGSSSTGTTSSKDSSSSSSSSSSSAASQGSDDNNDASESTNSGDTSQGRSSTPTTGSGSGSGSSSTSSTTSSTAEGDSTTPLTDVQTQSPAPTEAPTPAPAPVPTPEFTPADAPETISTTTAASPLSKPVAPIAPKSNGITSSSSSSLSPSPSPSPSKETKKKQTGPVTVRELERILMTNEEMEEDEQANDDMSGNVPDGDEPSPAMVQPPSPASAPSVVVSPSVSPSMAPSPSNEVEDWFPPATAPEPDVEPADNVPPAPNAPPPKSNDARSMSKLYGLNHVVFSGMVIWVGLAM